MTNDDASTEKSDYFTPPLTPGSTNPSSPQKEVSVPPQNNGSVRKVNVNKNLIEGGGMVEVLQMIRTKVILGINSVNILCREQENIEIRTGIKGFMV